MSCANARRRTTVLLRLVQCQHGCNRFRHQWSLLPLPEVLLPYPVLWCMSSTSGGSAAPQALYKERTMKTYSVHVYREMRLFFPGIVARTVQEAATLAAGMP